MQDRERDQEKARAAELAASMVSNGQTVGLGTGSTAAFAIEELGRRMRTGLEIRGVATSTRTEQLARRCGIPLVPFDCSGPIHLTIDGADEIDGDFNMIKGGGGALIREKLVAIASQSEIIIVDQKKVVTRLGETHSVPVEVIPFGWCLANIELKRLGARVQLRSSDSGPFVSDNGNYILDCDFGPISEPALLEKAIKHLPGVVESGLFIGLADKLVVGYSDHASITECANARVRPALI